MMSWSRALACAGAITVMALPAMAAGNECPSVTGDVVYSALTPQVDLYDSPMGKRVQTLDKDKFPTCLPVAKSSPSFMLEVSIGGTSYWVPAHMVHYHLNDKRPAICRNLAMGSDTAKVGATRALGEDCPKAISAQ